MKNKLTAGVALGCMILLVAAWMQGWSSSDKYSADPKIAELEKLRDQTIVKPMDRPDEDRRAEGEVFRSKVGELSEQQRQEFFERSMPVFIERMSKDFNERYNKLMAMSDEERRKELDKAIDEMEQRRSSGEGPGERPGGNRRGPPNMDPKKMDEMRKKMLDWTTPEMRAKFENSMQMMNDRRRERGLPPMNGPGGGPGGGFF